eukprot:TRINITY_DN6309_c0_g1_i4.p1 TRINITY_DN6309_c0_g1~~TRINITY_DN6309_c0_g1_i4.p1  ORF type:complete len:209 (+),score=35.95 TRINITY_DN6309_c0_g1_i4:219-845(+)
MRNQRLKITSMRKTASQRKCLLSNSQKITLNLIRALQRIRLKSDQQKGARIEKQFMMSDFFNSMKGKYQHREEPYHMSNLVSSDNQSISGGPKYTSFRKKEEGKEDWYNPENLEGSRVSERREKTPGRKEYHSPEKREVPHEKMQNLGEIYLQKFHNVYDSRPRNSESRRRKKRRKKRNAQFLAEDSPKGLSSSDDLDSDQDEEQKLQ